ncbi:hypothetical protein C7974DRAFT_31863 [Boeremia exigua]|uniref:uncharacterized protein n=1 Tax=Boeremia exigua TaxID=749465 RepID=UPI001E8E5040|nr:uncharacterized protein C7974DRAFT_31863 [Boeremia exigua]KAH6618532.1 hypothetical protein C7974DRAFT_31863 [Boeremia exigua]
MVVGCKYPECCTPGKRRSLMLVLALAVGGADAGRLRLPGGADQPVPEAVTHARACSQSIVTQPSRSCGASATAAGSLFEHCARRRGAGVGAAVGVGGSGPAQSVRTEIDRQQACKHLLHAGPWKCRSRRGRQPRHQSQS